MPTVIARCKRELAGEKPLTWKVFKDRAPKKKEELNSPPDNTIPVNSDVDSDKKPTSKRKRKTEERIVREQPGTESVEPTA